jgi:hypothetical protein
MAMKGRVFAWVEVGSEIEKALRGLEVQVAQTRPYEGRAAAVTIY